MTDTTDRPYCKHLTPPRLSPQRDIPTDPSGTRKLAFATFVRRALETARTTRAWTGTEVARRTGISRQTLNRWVRADWASDPEPERVVAFCSGLGLDPATAFTLLRWHQPAPSTTPLDPDILALMRRLADPRVPDQEKFHIRETVRYLAYRPIPSYDGDSGEPSGPGARRDAS
jgi:transcriptional regulator with XRE-family HTH domain